jgi:predicted alpha/beta-fold hydrolase
MLPAATIERNPYLTPAFSRHGGHVGFMGGTPWAPSFWAEEVAASFLTETLV